MKKILSILLILFLNLNTLSVYATDSGYQYSDSRTSGNVTLKVEWNEPVLGQETTFHVSASGGSGNYKFRMDSPSYSNPNETHYNSVADPSRGEWNNYTESCSSHDYTFTMMASGIYNFRFYLMDTESGVYYLRTNTYISVSDSNYPSVNTIVDNVVSQCKTDSEYQTALNLHDWLINQMEYDNSLNWCSTESAFTRHLGTCQSYEDAYKLLLNAAGITNEANIGNGHTWNAVKLDGEWYQIDCTWDDDSVNKYYYGEPTHLYFGLTDELMALAHTDHANNYTASGYGTRSTSLENNYYVKSGCADTWAESYRERIQTHLDNKETSFTISADNANDPPSISGIYNGIIAYAINQLNWNSDSYYVTLNGSGDSKQFSFEVSYIDSSTHVHSWNEGKVLQNPTYTSEGIKQYTCLECNTVKNEKIEKLTTHTEDVSYQTHVQDYGWQEWKRNGEVSGTSGQSKRLEGINITIDNQSVSGDILYRTHVQNVGWQLWKSNSEMSGTSGQSLRLEAIQIELTDELANSYDIYYRVHAQDYGWLDWAKNGECAGTEGKSKRLEAIQIVLVEKGSDAPGSTEQPFIFDKISYRTHVQDYGWQSYVSDGTLSGTSGQSKRLEGINIKLSSSFDGNILYRTHIQDYGWQDWVSNNQLSGTSGQSKRLEAIQIKLTGSLANEYDVYYRVHCQDYGWLGWAKNGESAGTEGRSKRLEAIQIVLVKKGEEAPGSTYKHFI